MLQLCATWVVNEEVASSIVSGVVSWGITSKTALWSPDNVHLTLIIMQSRTKSFRRDLPETSLHCNHSDTLSTPSAVKTANMPGKGSGLGTPLTEDGGSKCYPGCFHMLVWFMQRTGMSSIVSSYEKYRGLPVQNYEYYILGRPHTKRFGLFIYVT